MSSLQYTLRAALLVGKQNGLYFLDSQIINGACYCHSSVIVNGTHEWVLLHQDGQKKKHELNLIKAFFKRDIVMKMSFYV